MTVSQYLRRFHHFLNRSDFLLLFVRFRLRRLPPRLALGELLLFAAAHQPFGFHRAFLEFFNAAGRVYDFLFAGIERMAIRANFNMHLRQGSADGDAISARAHDARFRIIGRVGVLFHIG